MEITAAIRPWSPKAAFEAGSPPGSSGSQVVPAAKRPFAPRQRERSIERCRGGSATGTMFGVPAAGLTGRLTGNGRRTGLDGGGGPGTSVECLPRSGRVSLARGGRPWTVSPCSTRKRLQVRFLHTPPSEPTRSGRFSCVQGLSGGVAQSADRRGLPTPFDVVTVVTAQDESARELHRPGLTSDRARRAVVRSPMRSCAESLLQSCVCDR